MGLMVLCLCAALSVGAEAERTMPRTVVFYHMRKAAGTAIRKFLQEAYVREGCVIPGKLKHFTSSKTADWTCSDLVFHHIEFSCMAGSALVRAFQFPALEDMSKLAPPLAAPGRSPVLFVTCLRHPIDRLISLFWYGATSPGRIFAEQMTGRGQDQYSGHTRYQVLFPHTPILFPTLRFPSDIVHHFLAEG